MKTAPAQESIDAIPTVRVEGRTTAPARKRKRKEKSKTLLDFIKKRELSQRLFLNKSSKMLNGIGLYIVVHENFGSYELKIQDCNNSIELHGDLCDEKEFEAAIYKLTILQSTSLYAILQLLDLLKEAQSKGYTLQSKDLKEAIESFYAFTAGEGIADSLKQIEIILNNLKHQ